MSRVEVVEITSKELMMEAAAFTTQNPDKIPNINYKKLYLSEHSPIRIRWFWIKIYDMPYFVHTHFRTHRTGGTEHFTQTGREDRGADSNKRWEIVNHAIMINAQSLIFMARKRLCNKAHVQTRKIMWEIKKEIEKIDPDLASCLVPDCIYRGNNCVELKSCRGKFADNRKDYSLLVHPDFIKELEEECESLINN